MKSHLFLLLTLNIATNRAVCQTSPAAHHICDGTKTEQAGLSGSIEFTNECDLTLTNFTQPSENETHIYSIPGISAQGKCNQTGALSINSKQYCVDESVTDTVVDLVRGEMRLVLQSVRPESFTLTYYKVFIHNINPDVDRPVYLEGVISSADYPVRQLYVKSELHLKDIYLDNVPAELFMTFTLLSNETELTLGQHIMFRGLFEDEENLVEHDYNSIRESAISLRSIPGPPHIQFHYSSKASTGPAYMIKFQAVLCDLREIPDLIAAPYTIRYSEGFNLALPGRVIVTYECDKNEIETVVCATVMQSTNLLTAKWNTVKKCQRGANIITTVIVVLVIVMLGLIAAVVILVWKKKTAKTAASPPQARATHGGNTASRRRLNNDPLSAIKLTSAVTKNRRRDIVPKNY